MHSGTKFIPLKKKLFQSLVQLVYFIPSFWGLKELKKYNFDLLSLKKIYFCGSRNIYQRVRGEKIERVRGRQRGSGMEGGGWL